MSVPNWYEILLLAAAAFRVWRLISEDSILDKPRRYVTRLGNKWQKEGDPLPKEYRFGLAGFIDCPWCSGAWIGLAWWGAWQEWPHGTLVAAAPFAISALIGFAASLKS